MDEEVQTVRYFNGLATLGVNYFDQIYKNPDRENILEIIKVSRFFPQLVLEEDNQETFEECSKDKLQLVMPTFKNYMCPILDGWIIEFYLGFFISKETIFSELLEK